VTNDDPGRRPFTYRAATPARDGHAPGLIIGATFFWSRNSQNLGGVALAPSERIVLGDIYDTGHH